jgi:hypothetical protein
LDVIGPAGLDTAKEKSLRLTGVFGALAAALLAAPLAAQDNTELLNRMKAMEDRIKTLEAEVQSLKGQGTPATAVAQPLQPAQPAQPQPAAQPPVVEAPPPEGPIQLGGMGGAAAKALNPDISVIGDFLGAVGNPANRHTPSLEMHESEVGFQEIIDPYARADFFISFGEQGVNLEEGYLTFTSLPYGLQVKVGKMRAAFGKVNSLHNHVLPWTDRPLVTQDLVGGEDGINDAGFSLSRLLPAPKGIFLEGTAQLYRGDSDTVFQSRKRSDLSTVEHLRAYTDINESTNIDLGGSFARGRSPYAEAWNQLYGFDATLRWKPLRRAIYRSFVGRTEFIWARTQITNPLLPPGPFFASAPIREIRPYGFYFSGDYQLGRRWFLGGRFDRSQRGACQPTVPETTSVCNLPFTSLVQDTGGSVLLTYWPSEFSQIRAQLRRTHYGDSFTTNEFLFQFQFSMGAHGAHPF